ncbi:hypothetical protein SISNIDRAFT_481330 [Sistotremastrum niveocremeum HHB9708]|uniref:Transcription initiation factor TFIID subunit 12 domain-containing protein n=2 Tax=Sistotremastraceae TaxID=3402574 RepID=A0A165A8A2_9AGAM|nr:hypothetical protein SISNIDRAFT_481330 [Sistotremastrum niveocremeum HHB9708]KZT43457.1 hypothetical protein SISSUDRAFT_1057471 [Sistotremastrum suecicum HHB10207 ss-3]
MASQNQNVSAPDPNSNHPATHALTAVLSHPGMNLNQKIDVFRKLRAENKITDASFQQIIAALSKVHGPPGKPGETDATKVAGNSSSGFKRKSPGVDGPLLSADPAPYPMSTSVAPARSDAQAWPNLQGPRPTLSGGLASGFISGSPVTVARGPEDVNILLSGDLRHNSRKNTAVDQSLRRTVQDLVSSIDPNVKIDPELLLEVADEFIDSVANFACRIAKHRGGDTLEVRDLQLHLERNHNIRIPGFASDETRISISQAAIAPTATAPAKKASQGTHMTLRSARVSAVNAAKREGKLI